MQTSVAVFHDDSLLDLDNHTILSITQSLSKVKVNSY